MKFAPAPRECSTLTSCDLMSFLIGGSSIELEMPPPADPTNPMATSVIPVSSIYKAEIVGDHIDWKNVPFNGPDNIKGR